MERKEINSIEDLISSYLGASGNNDIEYVRFIKNTPLYNEHINVDINQLAFFACCEKDSIDVAKFLIANNLINLKDIGEESLSKISANNSVKILTYIFELLESDIKKIINYDENYLFEIASLYGNKEIIEILFSPIISYHLPNIKKSEGKPFLDACTYGNVDVVKLFLEDNRFKSFYSPMMEDGEAIKNACMSDNEELVEYLLSSTKIEKNADPHVMEDLPFIFASEKNMSNLLFYLIFTKKINKTKYIKEHLNYYHGLANKMFEVRDMKEMLERAL